MIPRVAVAMLAVLACAPRSDRNSDTPSTPSQGESAAASLAPGVDVRPDTDESAPRASGVAKTSARPTTVATSSGSSAMRTLTGITLERQACFGGCPVYRVHIDGSGRVDFVGRAHVRHQGQASATISAEGMRQLEAAVLAANLQSLSTSYTMDDAACGPFATDMPTVLLTVSQAGRTQTIKHDYGCSGAPRALRGLYRLIDSVANTNQWIGQS